MKVHPAPNRRNITVRYQSNVVAAAANCRHKKLRRLPHIFGKVLELPFYFDADVSVHETSDSLRFVANEHHHLAPSFLNGFRRIRRTKATAGHHGLLGSNLVRGNGLVKSDSRSFSPCSLASLDGRGMGVRGVGVGVVFVVEYGCTSEEELRFLKNELLLTVAQLPENAMVGFDSVVRVYDLGSSECLRVI